MAKKSKAQAFINIVKNVSDVILTENGQKFICGTYSDGTTRSVMDAARDEFMSPKTREKMTKKDKKKKKKKKKGKAQNNDIFMARF